MNIFLRIVYILSLCFFSDLCFSEEPIGTLYIISGPSGVGKTTLVNALRKEVKMIKPVVSYTTRKKRNNEKENIDYFFVTNSEFLNMIEDDIFLEYSKILDNFYGISRKNVIKELHKGVDLVLTVNWQGAREIRRKMGKKAVGIFIMPPSIKALSTRLKNRNQDEESSIQERVNLAKNDMLHCHEYDYVIYNNNFFEALENLKSIILANRLKLH